MTDAGRAHVTLRLMNAPDAEALRRVWESLGVEAQRDQKIRELKDRLKAELEGR